MKLYQFEVNLEVNQDTATTFPIIADNITVAVDCAITRVEHLQAQDEIPAERTPEYNGEPTFIECKAIKLVDGVQKITDRWGIDQLAEIDGAVRLLRTVRLHEARQWNPK